MSFCSWEFGGILVLDLLRRFTGRHIFLQSGHCDVRSKLRKRLTEGSVNLRERFAQTARLLRHLNAEVSYALIGGGEMIADIAIRASYSR